MTSGRTYDVSERDDRALLAVREYGRQCQQALAGPGNPEAAIRGPLERLLRAVADQFVQGFKLYAETTLERAGVRTDFAAEVAGAITGHVEVKSPYTDITPDSLRGHDKQQWERLQDLPNLLYTNGQSWALYRSGVRVGDVVRLDGDLITAGRRLSVQDGRFERLIGDFLTWEPVPILTIRQLVNTVAPLSRLLRHEVLGQLACEDEAIREGDLADFKPFTSLVNDWRRLLFPNATDDQFADGYAQTVVFALLLARSEGIELTGRSLHDIGDDLGPSHSVMGTALQLLTDPLSRISHQFDTNLKLVLRVVAAVDWQRVWRDHPDPYLHLYERFLDRYDRRLRRASGSYYTPSEVVEAMVRLVDDVLVTRMGYPLGLAEDHVNILDPAMGTGTFLHAVIHKVAKTLTERLGPGVVAGALTVLAHRLFGFELQMGPFAVAEMRAAEMFNKYDAMVPATGLKFFLTNTLDDPYTLPPESFSQFAPLAMSRLEANKVKANQRMDVYIGNPPYGERSRRLGNWVQGGSAASPALLDAYRRVGDERHHYVLQNLYIFFFSFGTWKLYEAHSDHRHGVLAVISAAGYLRGPGFKGMREFIRRTCDEGWIIDLSPEGMRPAVSTRVFPSVQQPLAIALLVRRRPSDPRHIGPDRPAVIRYAALHGSRDKKLAKLHDLKLDGDEWQPVRDDWQAPLTPGTASTWDTWPALVDLMPWSLPGVKPNRAWVYAPHPDILKKRWNKLVHAENTKEKQRLFKETERTIATKAVPLPGGHRHTSTLERECGGCPELRRVAYRSFDRQWLIPDSRLIDRPRPGLWYAQDRNVFVNEQHARPLRSGPGIVFTRLIPDMDHFKGSEGGRVLPMRHANGEPNTLPGLLELVSERLGVPVTVEDLVAYLAGVVAHRGYTERFADDLVTPGIRVPLTSDPALWRDGCRLGREVIKLHTYDGITADPLAEEAVTGLPRTIRYNPVARTLHIGTGRFAPVPPAVWEYDVGGMPVVRKWLSYRKAEPGGRTSSELDDVHIDAWPHDWTVELCELLTMLRRLVELEPEQADLLDSILAGPQLSVAGLLPVPDAARRARRGGPDLFTPER